eukprot:gene8418-5898_t
MSGAYHELEQVFTKRYRFEHLQGLASWDMNCYMPDKGSESRGEAMAAVETLLVELITAPKVKDLVEEANKHVSELSPLQAANLREMTHHWKMANLLPLDFVQRQVKLTTKAHIVWRESREKNDFATFLPVLKELIAASREAAGYLMDGKKMHPYEALLQQYEPGMSLNLLEKVFGEVRAWLPGLLKDILEKQKSTHQSLVTVEPPFPQKQQEELGKEMMKVWNFDFEAGRLDVSPHPFTGMTKEDTRITTAYKDNDLEFSLYAVIHETGHAKYEQNCGPRDMITQPVCTARSLGIHESQSLFAEFQIGRSTPFIKFLVPKLSHYLGSQKAFTEENMKKFLQRVQPGYIRVEADEVCYPLHVILRFEIEKALIEGTMQAEDVPRVWNEKMKEYLGLETLGKDNLGCLQDVHWSMGAFGYFPTYALGAMFAAQLMHTIRKELGSAEVDKAIEKGDLACLLAKQKEKIWDNGCIYETEELMVKATGEPLNADYLRRHLEERYLSK